MNHHFQMIGKYVDFIATNDKLISKIQAETPRLKIVDKKIDTLTNEVVFIVQIMGKNIFPKITFV
jgi:hypothetical protein